VTYDPFALARPSAAGEVLARFGHRLGKSLGQHLLVDRRVLERIVATAGIAPSMTVLEVGPGIGTLTRALAASAREVISVECDRRLEPVLAETLAGADNVRLVWGDALKLAAAKLDDPDELVANLPYNVAATVVLRYLDELALPAGATVMVQREVGERMAASPGGKDYGGYTVKLALRAAARVVFRVPPSSFMPPPRVESVVVRLSRDGAVASDVPAALVDRVADAAFAQRRKMLRSSLSAGLALPAVEVEKVLASAGIDPHDRAEVLTPADFVTLSRRFARSGLVTLRP
jgi:16S rRNA (adenine1518-N6/adenine1519-N6)-dimethyltransferase